MPTTSGHKSGTEVTGPPFSTMLSYKQLVVLCGALTALAQGMERWIAPAQEHCVSQRTPNCSTLQEYRESGAFLQSNTVWTFMKGNHHLQGGVTSFVNASNVLLTGEKECEVNNTACSIHCEDEKVCMLLFASSNNITIQHLHFVYPERFLHSLLNRSAVDKELNRTGMTCCYTNDTIIHEPYEEYKNCIYNRSWVFLDVQQVTVKSVQFTGYHSHWAIVRPSGNYSIQRTNFSNIYSAPILNDSFPRSPEHQIAIVLSRPASKTPANIVFERGQFSATSYFPVVTDSVEVKDNKTMSYPVIHVISQEPLQGWTVNITIADVDFCKCSALQLSAVEDPGLIVTVDKVNISGGVTHNSSASWNRNGILYMASAIRLFTTNRYSNLHCTVSSESSSQSLSTVTIKASSFRELLSGKGCALLIDVDVARNCSMVTQFVFKGNNVSECHSQQVLSSARSVMTVRQKIFPREEGLGNVTSDWLHRVIIDSNNMSDNFKGRDESCLIMKRHGQYLERKRQVNATADCQLTCYWQGVVYVAGFSRNGRVLFRSNQMRHNKAQGLTLNNAVVEVAGNNLIYWSSSHYGSGIMTVGNSLLLLQNGSHLNMSRNQAYICGGAIFVLDRCTWDPLADKCETDNPCFFEVVDHNGGEVPFAHLDQLNVSVTLDRNKASAKTSGIASMIFNSNIDQCHMRTNFTNASNMEVFQRIFSLDPRGNYTDKEISSIPRRICRCSDEDKLKYCQLEDKEEIDVYPGQNFTDNIAVIGDMDIPQSALLYIKLIRQEGCNESIYIPLEVHSMHVLTSKCNHITTPPIPTNERLALQLTIPLLAHTPNKANNVFLVDYINIRQIYTCPPGYKLDTTTEKHHRCVCLQQLKKRGIVCSLEKRTFSVPKNHWIGMKPSQTTSGLVFSPTCPAIFCATANATMEVSLKNHDMQCKHGRTGILCGQCPKNKSVVLGSLACQQCDSNAGILIVLLHIVAGPLLIAVICLLNLTVSAGSINGILLYLTVIAINKDVLHTHSHSDKILSLMTFDFMIESCFYIGMDEFAKNLISYAFPLYLLLLVGVAMCLPRWRKINMHRINRLIGPRITPVLATVILISYTKLAVCVIESLLPVRLFDAESGDYTYVWLFDGSLEYFGCVQHILLATIALLVFLCFLLPVTVIAIFGDLFRRFFRGPWYMNFLDTLHGAFRFRFGFWIGIRMLIGVVVMTLKVSLVEPSQIFMATATVAMAALLFQNIFWPYRAIRIRDCITERIKKKYFPPNVCQKIVHSIDNCYLINIVFVFMYLVHNPGQIQGVLSLSVAAAGLECVGILIYHALEYTPLGVWLIDTRFKLRRRYRRWREERKEALHLRNENRPKGDSGTPECPCELELVFRAPDCRDSDSSDSSSSSDSDDGCESKLLNSKVSAMDTVTKEHKSTKQTEGQAPSGVDKLQVPLLS